MVDDRRPNDLKGDAAIISRTPVSCRPTAVSASLLGGLVCVAAALALSAAPAWAAKCPGGVCAHGAASASVGAISEFPISTANGRPTEITAGPDGNLWFTEQGGNKIGRITPSGAISEFTIPSAESEPYGIAAGHDGNLWFTEQGGNKIGRITPSGTISEFPTPRAPQPGVPGLTYGGFPQGIAAGSDGNLWFTEYVFGTIGRITPSGTISEFTIPSTESHPEGIAAGPDGNLWFTERRGEKIGRITPGGTIREFPIPAGGGQGSYGITTGPDGDLWFTRPLFTPHDEIGRITPSGTVSQFRIPTANSLLDEITAGPDGNLWFTELRANKIGRITPSGAIDEFPVPTAKSLPFGITAGPDGNLWFTESKANKIGRITSASAAKCVVPKLKGRTLTQAKKLLGRAHCKLGKVAQPAAHKHAPVVVSQKPAAKKVLPSGSKVSVRLG